MNNLESLWLRYNQKGIGVAMFRKLATSQGYGEKEQQAIINKLGYEVKV